MPPRKKVTKKKPVKKRADPLTIILYSPSGNGKTSWAAQWPRPGFICDNQERGIYFLSRRNLVPEPVWIDLDHPVSPGHDKRGRIVGAKANWRNLVDSIWNAARDDSIETLVCETVTGFEAIGFASSAEENYDGKLSGKKGFFAYGRGPSEFSKYELPEFIDALDTVWQSGKSVILTAHSQVISEEAPEGTNVQKHVPYADKKIWPVLHRWASGVFFIGRRVEEDDSSKGLKTKARRDVYDRLLYVEGTAYVDAKNWLGLEGVIPLGNTPRDGYRNFMRELENKDG